MASVGVFISGVEMGETKECARCHAWLSLTEFRKQATTRDGLRTWCRRCCREYLRTYYTKHRDQFRRYAKKQDSKYPDRAAEREYHRRWMNDHPEVSAAGNAVNNAITAGRIARPSNCEICEGIGNIHGHHPDYNKKLEVAWLCRQCHNRLHVWLREIKRGEYNMAAIR
jgi:hypothetical protein